MPCDYSQTGAHWGTHSYEKPHRDEAVLQLMSQASADQDITDLLWYGITKECSLGCEPQLLSGLSENSCATVYTRFPYRMKATFTYKGESHTAHKELDLNALAEYTVDLNLNDVGEPRIELGVMHGGPPTFTYLWGPLLTMCACMAVAPFVVSSVVAAWNKMWSTSSTSSSGGGGGNSREDTRNPANAAPDAPDLGYSSLPITDVEAAASGGKEAPLLAAVAPPPPPAKSGKTGGKTGGQTGGGGGGGGGSERLNSLDTMRGLSLSLMIFVNYGGGGYWWLDHSAWNGLTVADLLFPWFMWMMGVSMALAFKARKAQRQTRGAFVVKVLKRSMNLVLISLFTDAPWNMKKLRLPGVLQYFAFSYLWVSLAVLWTGSWDGEPAQLAARMCSGEEAVVDCRVLPATLVAGGDDDNDGGAQSRESVVRSSSSNGGGGAGGWPERRDDLAHLRPYWRELGPVLTAPAIWLVLTFAVHVPGCGRGYLGPGGVSDGGKMAHCTGGSHRYIDRLLLGVDHLYDEPTCMEAYQCTPYDPEGIVGAFNAVLLTYLGLVAGRVFLHHKRPAARMAHLVVLALPSLAAAAVLCGCKQDGGWIPVNKNLWSTSYVLLMAGLGSVLLSFTYGVVDRWRWWDGAPLRYMGMNSIAVYVGSDIFETYFPFGWHTNPRQHWGELLSNCVGVCTWFAVATELHRRKIFFKV